GGVTVESLRALSQLHSPRGGGGDSHGDSRDSGDIGHHTRAAGTAPPMSRWAWDEDECLDYYGMVSLHRLFEVVAAQLSPREVALLSFLLDEALPAPHPLDPALWAGDSAGDSGDSAGDSGDSAGDSGDSAGDSGDSAGDSGDSAGDSGDSAGDSGDSAGDSGDSAGDSGDSAGDSAALLRARGQRRGWGHGVGTAGTARDGLELLLEMERRGLCHEGDLGQLRQLLRLVTRHDLLRCVTLKRPRP
ncbi:DEDD2 protein, partial [Drymodes brunneopygia]|nr:DEDD2 protein [Drymodes brunneopygia]